jgi:hypothetical protein
MKPATHTIPKTGGILELLEPRIAPASLSGINYTPVTLEDPQLITAGNGLSTSAGSSGSLLLAVEQGMVKVFTTDLNGNGRFDPNEITGLSVGDRTRLTLFVDVNGDVVTNLQANGELTDSGLPDPRRADDPLYRDGRVLLNSNIEAITLRSVTAFDLRPGETVEGRVALSSYSIHGNIYAGSVGVRGQGIVIDASGLQLQTQVFRLNTVDYQQSELLSNIGGIRTGTAVNGHAFNFGYVTDGTGGGTPGAITVGDFFVPFTPGVGQDGGDVIGLRSGSFDSTGALVNAARFTIDAIIAGDGGIGARGGNIQNVSLFGDSGGLRIIAGQGGIGANGGNGGSILNLADLGSTNGMVEIRAGNGGAGLTGNAGAAGSLTLGQFDMNGQLFLGLGSGGDGLFQGGVGTALLQANFKPTDANGTYSPIKVLSTYHVPGQLGSVAPIDFNGDGFTDLIYLTDTPDQVMIRFGGPAGIGAIDVTPTLYFATPGLSSITDGGRTTGVTAGDFNRDGFLDLAIAPSVTNSFGPIRVFLNPGGTDTAGFGSGNGWSQAALLPRGGNYIDSYVASPMPFFNDDRIKSFFPFDRFVQRSGMPVTNMVSGEFNSDPNQFVDLGLTAQVFTYVEDPADFREFTTVAVFSGTGDGRFFADFLYNSGTNQPTQSPVLATVLDRHGEVQLLATARDVTAPGQPEVLVVAALNDGEQKVVEAIQWQAGTGALGIIAQGEPIHYTIKVKDGRFDGYDGPKYDTPAAITITDVDANGRFEVAVLGAGTPSVSLLHTPQPSLFPGAPGSFAFNSGVALKGEQVLIPALGFNQPVLPGFEEVNFLRALGGQFTNNSAGNPVGQLALYSYGGGFTNKAFYLFGLTPYDDAGADRLAVQFAGPGGARTVVPVTIIQPDGDINLQVLIQDLYKQRNSTSLDGFVTARPTTNLNLMGIDSAPTPGLVSFRPIAPNTISLVAGAGGDSAMGLGGRGGDLGSGFASVTGSAFSVILPSNRFLQPDLEFTGGAGGYGFERGGAGGSLRGMYVDYAEGTAVLASDGTYIAGFGGAGIFGAGGVGGNVWGNKIETGAIFQGGLGGAGEQGGAGGSVIGGGGLFGYDNYNGVVLARGGDGGFGIGNAGSGGSITQFANLFPPLTAGQGGLLQYFGGNGGESLAGTGGSGGFIRGSSPIAEVNKLVGVVQLTGGQGGDGLVGGAGGGIDNFRNPAGLTDPLPIFSAIAGHGGDGVTGKGGDGGSITNFNASANGIIVSGQFGLLVTGRFNRILAGNGGSSFAGDGGAGGKLELINSAANNSAIVAIAGRGGDGLRLGGVGGSVLRTNLDSPIKIVVMAGDGGDAFGALANAPNVRLDAAESALITNLRAFGGVNGVAGNGGSISDFKQSTASDNVATDLIAGQGGSLVNYGSAAPGAATGVGMGGSLSKILLLSQAGRGRAAVAIAAYDPIPVAGGAQVEFADFVRTANGWTYSIGDSVRTPTVLDPVGQAGGNVGVIVGAAGTVRGGSFAGDGLAKAGSVTTFSAKSIMSMVAGSVDNVASIRSVSALTVTGANGVFGAFKDFTGATKPHNLNTPLYFDPAGLQTNDLLFGGRLIDGAIAAQRFTPATLVGLPRVWQI